MPPQVCLEPAPPTCIVTSSGLHSHFPSDGKAKRSGYRYQIRIIRQNGFRLPDVVEGCTFEDGPARQGVIEPAAVDQAAIAALARPTSHGLPELSSRAYDPTEVQDLKSQIEQRLCQFLAQRLVGLKRPQVKPSLARRQAETANGSCMVPVGWNPRHGYPLICVLHSLKRREHVKRRTKACEGSKEVSSALRRGVEHAELASGTVEAAATYVFPWWPCQRIGAASDTVERRPRSTRPLDGTHPWARKERAACRT